MALIQAALGQQLGRTAIYRVEELPPEELKGFNEAELEAAGFWGMVKVGTGRSFTQFHLMFHPFFKYSFLVPSDKLKGWKLQVTLAEKIQNVNLFWSSMLACWGCKGNCG